MRRIFFIIIAMTISLLSKGYEVQYERISSEEMLLNFNISDLKIVEVEREGVIYSMIDSDCSISINKKGYAELPKISATIQIGDKNDVSISSFDGEYSEIQLDHPLLPSRGSIYRNQDPSQIPYEIDPSSITDDWYPEIAVENESSFIYRDVKGVNIYAYPIQYNSEKNVIRVYKKLTLTINEKLSKSSNPLTVKPDYIDPSMNGIYKSLFINYEYPKFVNQLGELGEILVIYTSRDASVIQPYIDWKREKGFKVSAIEVPTGTNVKATISNAYVSNPNLLYIQLVGGWEDIKCDTQDYGIGDGFVGNAPNDPMLGCVVGTDLYPELIIGRFSAESTSDVTTQVLKTINYEKNPDLSGTWYKNGLGIGSSEGSGIGDDGEIDYNHIDIIKENKLLPFNYSTVYEAYDNPTATATEVGNYLDAGLGVINYCGHGASTKWVTSDFSTTNVNNSTNASKLPFIFSVACVNGKFQESAECFAEAWLRKSGGGAVATFMATINQPWTPPQIAQDYMNDILTGGYNYSANPGSGTSTSSSDQRTTFGSVTMNGNILMLSERGTSDTEAVETHETWTIFGDASLQVRTDTPTLIDNQNSSVLPDNYSTTITAGGSPVEGAVVTLCKDGINITGLTNSSGFVSLDHSFFPGDNVTLTVTGYNLETEQSVQLVEGDIGGTYSQSTSSLSFGSLVVGNSSTLQFTISNSHNTEYILGDITTIAGYSVALAVKGDVKNIKNVLSYSVGPNESKTFDLKFEPGSGGEFNGNITISSSDTNHLNEYIAISGTCLAPDINLNPISISASAVPDATDIKLFNVENTDVGQLDYTMSINFTGGKDIKGSGGPDSYGYNWKDSDEADGPDYNWIDITGSGTSVTLTDDSFSAALNLGFAVDFYGTDYSSVKICSNGFISFTSSATAYANATIPTAAVPNNLIALFWDDLNPSAAGDIYYYADTANDRFIVTYNGVSHLSAPDYNTGQIIIYSTGRIVLQYQETGASTINTCTVGIENADGTDGSLVTYNSAYLHNDMAIQFQTASEWLTLNSTSGSINGVGNDQITATCDATGLELGTYTADIYIASNDPDESTKILPVIFTVSNLETGGSFALDNSSLSFGDVAVGSNIVKTFEITNSHSTEYLIGNITTIDGYTVSLGSKESVKNIFDFTIAPNSSKIFDLSFEPSSESAYIGNITITSSDAGHSTEFIAVTGIGTLPDFRIPFSEDFNASLALPTGWEIVDHQSNGQVWQFGSHTYGLTGADGNYAYLFSDGFGSGGVQIADLITPAIDMSNASDINLSFQHYYNWVDDDRATLSYSIDGGSNWVQVQQWSADTANPATFNQALSALDGQSNVKIKWNYTGTYDWFWDIDNISITGTVTNTTPEIPSNIVTSISGSDLILDWDASVNATSYDIYSSDDPNVSFTLETNVTTNQYTIPVSTARKFYYIIAKN
ncbi:MAG: C25 family cysteine peptidase [Candidatus Delongbacteria bacterium]|jgi:hypothetical protein|nr:C25 family cysteine peptidase [Candidatus Delongbacteria bacterium]